MKTIFAFKIEDNGSTLKSISSSTYDENTQEDRIRAIKEIEKDIYFFDPSKLIIIDEKALKCISVNTIEESN